MVTVEVRPIYARRARGREVAGCAGVWASAMASMVVAAMGDAGAIDRAGVGVVVEELARWRARCIYSPKNFLRLVLDDFRCAVRSLEGHSA